MLANSLRKYASCCFVFIILLILWQFLYLVTHEKNIKVINYEPKFILLYEVPSWMKTKYHVNFTSNCVVTTNKNYFADIRKFDALVFSGSDNWTAEETFPILRSPHQYYVFADHETPFYTLHKFSKNSREIYNLTMTYREDSDIYWPYGFITDQNITYLSDPVVPIWKTPNFENNMDHEILQKIKKKKRTAAWFVSNCQPPSKRTFLVISLRRHIDVDVYGKCAALQCDQQNAERCYEFVEGKYFFYLSFENSLCKDYLTEKVFNIMQYYIVPVVYGGSNYSNHLPPHSYIDANDFATATELASYLKYLTNNIQEYVKYFWWKKYYKSVRTSLSYNNLCDKLYKFTSVPGQQFVKSYKNIDSWLNDGQCGTTPKIKFN
ncbi:alpha-(1,3)-fucosyltransferase C-like [Phlebotomus papatasi]|uniref:alpha-(1,3)-fucosyltransferase C-like n=1 Tax=Phlebotomus papatasi TaxID=29031 RepID=UPI00248394AE|nr:alpha-(1,3)-fucosyltransferase C-like [Phlebotomus papatasi]